MKNAIQNLQSATYSTQWGMITEDLNAMTTQYIMGQIDEATWNSYVESIVNSDDYKAIQQEFKDAAAAE